MGVKLKRLTLQVGEGSQVEAIDTPGRRRGSQDETAIGTPGRRRESS